MKRFLVLLLVLCAVPAMAQVPSGQFTYAFTNAPLWDLSGVYTNNTDTNDMVISTINCRANGQIAGSRVELYVNGADNAAGTGAISGKTSIKTGQPQAALVSVGELSGVQGGADYLATFSSKGSAVLNAPLLTIFTEETIRDCVVHGQCVTETQHYSIALPQGMNGDWILASDVAANGNKLTGTGTITLSNGRILSYQIIGSYNTKSQIAKLKLIGQGDAKGTSLSLTTQGTGMDLVTLKGKVLGQKPAFPSDSVTSGSGISWMIAGSGPTPPDVTEGSRITAWKPGWQMRNLFIGECCATQGVYDFSKFDAEIASNKIWMAPYESKVKVCMEWGSYVTLRWNNGVAVLTTNTGYEVRPQWFWNLAPIPQDMSHGPGPGSDIADAQVSAASQIIKHFIIHEGPGKITALGIAWEPDVTTNYSLPEAAVASSVADVARANGVMIVEGELGHPIYHSYATWAGSNSYDAIAFHADEWAGFPLDYGDAPENPGLRYDQMFDAIGALGKPMLMDLLEIFYACDPNTNAILADRFVKGILMMRKSGVIGIFPMNYQFGIICAPGFQIGAGQGAYLDSDNVPTPVGQAILNTESLIGNNTCSTSSVQYPYYYYRFGTNVFVWIAENYATTGMVLSGWSSDPTYARDGTVAPTNTLGNSPIVLSGDGTITLY
jgi:hypothetical protein